MIEPATSGALIRSTALPALEASLLLSSASGLSREQLITRREDFDTRVIDRFHTLCTRRSAGEPVAYLVGERAFYGRVFRVTPDVLIPRPETELLVDCALERAVQNAKMLDLGTGSGAIAISLACERPDLRVTATDVSLPALKVARGNAERLDAQVEFVESDWLDAFDIDRWTVCFDVIVSNPPYVAAVDRHLIEGDLRYEPPRALVGGSDGLAELRRIIEDSPPYLIRGGWLMLEHGYDQAELVRALLVEAGFDDVRCLRDLAGMERVSIARRPDPVQELPIPISSS